MPAGNRLLRAVGRKLEQACVARLDLVAQRRALAVGHRHLACRGRVAQLLVRLDLDVGEPRAAQVVADLCDVVVAVRRAREKARRVVREHGGDGAGDVVGEGVVFDAVPDAEHEAPAGFQHATRLAVAGNSVREEHGAELAQDHIERGVLERQGERIGLPPFDAVVPRLPRDGVVEHGGVEVGHHVARTGAELGCQHPRDRAAAGRRFQHRAGRERSDQGGHVDGVALEDQGDHQRVVELRDRAREHLVAFVGHGNSLKALNRAGLLPCSNESVACSGMRDGDDGPWWPCQASSSTPLRGRPPL
ncbi:hypothetical protein D3C72_1311280 [compost metagenome]